MQTTAPLRYDDLPRYMPLVRQTAARFLRKLPPNVMRDDLVAAGTWGLIDSLRKNGPERGPAFETYARIRIRGAILDELRSQDWLSRRGRSQVAAQDRDAGAPDGAAPTLTGLVAFGDLPTAQRASAFPGSLPSPLEAAEESSAHEALERAIDRTLLERECQVVRLHYFQGVEFKDIADDLGVSAPRVSQLHARAMEKLRAALSSTTIQEAT